jgi:hypothetical protein
MSDLSVYTADKIIDWMTQNEDLFASPNIYVGLINPNGTDVSPFFRDGRVETLPNDWDKIGQTKVVNADFFLFEDSFDVVDIQSVALFESELGDGGEKLAEIEVTNAPVTAFPSDDVKIQAGELELDILDVTE